MNDQINPRLARIEEKLDQLTEAFNLLHRMDERLVNHHNSMSRLGNRVDECDKRLRNLEIDAKGQGVATSNIERIGWIVFSACIGLAVWLIKKGAV
ncbi:MAG: hypothetical protein HON94_04725 [Methylococcales bacterium]|jgi:hypothetical protein|nr:hypothetical protein [Methylococcales bacterium]